MDNQKLAHAIDVQHEIKVLNNISIAASKQPYLDFFFTDLNGKNDQIFTIKNEALVYEILRQIEDRKVDLKKEFEEL